MTNTKDNEVNWGSTDLMIKTSKIPRRHELATWYKIAKDLVQDDHDLIELIGIVKMDLDVLKILYLNERITHLVGDEALLIKLGLS
jgi:hypothetical protein